MCGIVFFNVYVERVGFVEVDVYCVCSYVCCLESIGFIVSEL